MKLTEIMEGGPGSFVGPKGFGASPESGGESEQGVNRIQSTSPHEGRLTPKVQAEVRQLFSEYDVDIKKIDKTRKGYIRVWYNGSLHTPYK